MGHIEFTVFGEPKGKGRPRFTSRGHAYTPKETVEYENLIRTEWMIQTNRSRFPDGSTLKMDIEAFYKIPKSANKNKKAAMLSGEMLPTKKPDVDNIIKVVADALNGLAYKDDAAIVNISCNKVYSENPRIKVMIQELKEGD